MTRTPLRPLLTLALALGCAFAAFSAAQDTRSDQSTQSAQSTQPQSPPPQEGQPPQGPPAPTVQPAPTSPSPAPSAPAPTAPAPSSAPQETASEPGPTPHEEAGRCVEGTENACLELTRKDKDGKERRILVIRTGVTDDTGVYIFCTPLDDDPPETPTQAVFSETTRGGIRILIDKNTIRVPLALVTQKPAKDDQEKSGDGRVEASAGTATFLETVPEGAKDRLVKCGVDVRPRPVPDTVRVTQGKTELKGQKLIYDETDGVARVDGPITFRRADEQNPIEGSSERIEVNVDQEKTVLLGNVVLRSEGGRVSKAPRMEYDDAKNEARLFAADGQPAESVKGKDVLRIANGSILYDMGTDQVNVRVTTNAGITGEFEDAETPKP